MIFSSLSLKLVCGLCCILPAALGATAEEWRNRTIYQLITDRFAPSTPNAPCVLNPNVTRYCGGTWSSLTSHLDYIQSLGFTAIWISPTSPQINSSLYGEAYHGYWPINHQLLNPHFGTTTDLIALSNEVHKRGMYLMVDIVLNHLASLSTDTTVVKMKSNMAITGQMMFSDPLEFHPPCVIDEMNQTSLERCWFSLRGYKLMDLATETEGVRGKMEEWIKGFVETFQVDGLRLDLAKYMDDAYLSGVCASAGVFCMGEVGTGDIGYSSRFQQDKVLDSVLSYPMWYGLLDTFVTGKSMSKLCWDMWQVQLQYTNPRVLGTFIENHDQVRVRSLTSDEAVVYNALVATYMFEGIPIVYYAFETNAAGGADPYNRPALWQSTNYTIPTVSTSTSQRIIRLNKLRTLLGNDFINANSTRQDDEDSLAMTRGETLTVLTNRGEESGSVPLEISLHPFLPNSSVVDVLSCSKGIVAANGNLTITFQSGLPQIWLEDLRATASGICGSCQRK